MTDAAGKYLRLIASEDTRFAAVEDAALDDVLRKGQDEFVSLLRRAVDGIGQLSDGGPAREARRKAKLTWLAACIASLDPLQ